MDLTENQKDDIRKQILYILKNSNGITTTDVIDGCKSHFYGWLKFDNWYIMDELGLIEGEGLIEFRESKYYFIDKESKN